jgi:predicted Zn-dependent protease
MSGMTPAMGALNSYAEMRAHFLICTQLWNDEVVHWTLPAGDYPFAESTFDYTNALAAIRRGDLAGAREAVSRVEKDGQRVIAWAEKQEMGAMDMHDPVDIYNGQLHALLAAADGKTKEAVAELRQMAEKEHHMPLEFGPPTIEKPTDELLGEVLLQSHRPSEARDAFQTALARTPGRRMVVENLARADKEMAAVAAAKSSTGAAPNNH